MFDCIQDLLDRQARATPDRPAIHADSVILSYAELTRRANQFAWYLRGQGVGRETPVGVCLERTGEWPVVVLGILKAGATYVPLDPAPPQRLACMLEDVRPPVLISEQRSVNALPAHPARLLLREAIGPEVRRCPTDTPPHAADLDTTAFLLFTSGSTGRPKGVLGLHRALVNRCAREPLPFGPDEVCALKTSSGFIDSLWELFAPLARGLATAVIPQDEVADPRRLIDRLARFGVTRLVLVPSLLRALLDSGVDLAAALPRLRYWSSTGEPLPADLCERFEEALPDRTLINLYGTTEVWDVAWCDARARRGPGNVPVGRPLPNVGILLLDERMNPVPEGEIGEICVAGDGVARGYLTRPEGSAARFLPNPFAEVSGERLYRTGDLGRRLPDGNLECLGRSDRQVKLRGVRVELGEIEVALRRHPAVTEAVAVVRTDVAAEPRLVAYVTAGPNAVPDPRLLRAWLKDFLPPSVIPSHFVRLDRLPLTSSGKVHRDALPAPTPDTEARPAGAPRSPLEAALAVLWSEVLGVEPIGPEDDFFDLGGHSLLAVQLLTRVCNRFEVGLSPSSVFDHPTLAGFTQVVSAALQSQPCPADVSPPPGIAADAVLCPEIIPAPGPPAGTLSGPSAILLTGATGFLGAFLARELADRSRATVYCLTRARTQPEADRRLRQGLEKRLLWETRLEGRLVAVPGDLSRPYLGVPRARYDELAATVDRVLHCGAQVHFLHAYGRLRGANVVGTREALRFACRVRGKPFHHVSTLAVLDTPANRGRTVRETEVPALSDLPFTGYGQSKLVAEHLVLRAADRGLPVSIYRCDDVSGHSRTGVWNPTDFLWLWLKGCVQLGLAPDIDVTEYMVPVDQMSRAIAHLALTEPARGSVYHLCNPDPINWKALAAGAVEAGHALRLIPYREWQQEMIRLGRRHPDNALGPLVALFTQPLPGQEQTLLEYYFAGRRALYDDTAAVRALSGANLLFTGVSPALLSRYLAAFARAGYFPPPERAQADILGQGEALAGQV